MKHRRPKLHLVGQDPADVFDDLGKLRADLTAPPQRRPHVTETFARIPHDKALALKISGDAWAVLIELDRMILKARGRNPIRFWNSRLNKIGLRSKRRWRALRELERAGVILVKRIGRGLAPWVFHTWYSKHP
jgi:hypothetical protein